MADPKAFKGLGNLPAAPAAPKPVAPKPTTAVKPSVPAVPMTEPQKRAAEEFAGQTNVGLAVQKAKQEQIKLQQDLRYEILKRYPNLSLDEVNRLVDEEAAKFVQPLAASSFAGTIDPYSLISPSKQPMNIPATQPPGFIDVFRPQTRAPSQEKIAYSQANPYDSSASIQRILDQGLPKEEQENALAILKAKSAVFSKLKQKNPGLNIIQLSSMVENEIANLPTAMSGTGEKTVVRQPMAGNLQEQTPLEAAFDIQQTGAEVPKLTEAQLEFNRALKKEQLPTLLARERAKLEQELVPEVTFKTIVTPGFPEGTQQEVPTGKKRKLTEAEINERLLKFQDEAIPWWADPEKLEEYKTKGAPPSTIGILSTELVTGNVVEAPVGYAMRVLTAPLNAIAGAVGYTSQSIYDAVMGTDIQAKKEAGRGEKFQAPGLKSNIIANIATGGGYTSEVGEFGYYNPNETIQSFYPAFYGLGFLVDLSGLGDIGLIKGAAGGVRGAAAGARAATTAAGGAPTAVKAAEAVKGAAQFGTATAATEFIRELPIVGEKLAKEISPQDVRVVYGAKLGQEMKDAINFKNLYNKIFNEYFISFDQYKTMMNDQRKLGSNSWKWFEIQSQKDPDVVDLIKKNKREEALDLFMKRSYEQNYPRKNFSAYDRENFIYEKIKNSGFFEKDSDFVRFAKRNVPEILVNKLDPKSESFYFKGLEDEFNELENVFDISVGLARNVDVEEVFKFFDQTSVPEYRGRDTAIEDITKPQIDRYPSTTSKFDLIKSGYYTIPNASQESLLKPYVTFLARRDSNYKNILKSNSVEDLQKFLAGARAERSIKNFDEKRIREIQKLIGSNKSRRIKPSDIFTINYLIKQNQATKEITSLASFAAGVKAVDKSLSKIGLTGTRLVAVTPRTFAAPRQADRIMEVFKKGDLYQNVTSKLNSFNTTQFKSFYGDIVSGINLSDKELNAIQSSLGSGYASGLITRKDFDRIRQIASNRKLISYDDLRLLSYAEVDIIAKELKQGITSEMLAEAPVSAKIDQPVIAKTVAQQRRVEELKSDLPLLANRALNFMKDKIQPIKAQLNPQQTKLVDEALGRVSALNITLRDEYQRSLKDPEYAALYEINKDDDVEERIIKLSIGLNRSENSRQLYIKELISSMIFSTDNTALYNAFFSGYHFGASALDYVDKMNDIINKYSGLRPKQIRDSLEQIYEDVKNLVETDINPIRKARGGKIFTIPKDMQRDALIVAYFRFKVLNITADTLTRSISNRPFSISDEWISTIASFAGRNAYKFNTKLLTRKDIQNCYYAIMKSELMNTDSSSLSSLIAKYNDNIYEIKAYENLVNTENTALLPTSIRDEIRNLELRNEDIIYTAGERSLPKKDVEEPDVLISGSGFGLKTPEPPKSDVKEAKPSDTWPGGDFGDSVVEVPEEVATGQLPEPEIKFTPEELQEIKDNKDKIESIIKNYMDETKTKVNELKSTNPNLIPDFLRPIIAETFRNFSPQQIEATTKTMADALIAKPELIDDVTYAIQSLVDTGIINRLPNSDAGGLEDTIRTLDLLARENVSPNSFTSPAMVQELKKQLGGEPKFNQLLNELARLSDAAAGGSSNAIAVSIAIRKALQMWNSFYYNMMLSINPRFQFPNILTAPFIISYTTGKNVIGRESLNNAKSAMKAMAMGSPMATEAGRRSIAVVDKFGVPYTHGDIYDLCVKRGVFKSQASTEIPANFLEDARAILNSGMFKKGPLTTRAQVTAGDVARARGPIAKILSPVEEFIGDPMATYTDNVWRAFVVIDAIKGGSTIDDALMLGRKSLFDYGNVTSVERDFARRFFVFYNYFRQGVGQFVKNLFEDPSRTIKLMRLNKGISEGSMAIFGGEKEDVSFYYPPDWGVSRAVFSVTPAKKYKEGKAILSPNMPYSDGLNVIGGVLVDPVGAVIGPQKAAGMGRAFEEGLFTKQLGPIWEMAGLMFFTPNALNTIKLTKNRIPPEHMALYYVAGLDQHVTSTFNVRVEDAKPGENALDGKAFVVDAEDFERYKMLVAATQTVGVSRPMSDWGKVFGGAGVMIGRNPRLTGSYPENLPEFLANTTGAITVSGAGRPSDVQVEVLEAQQLQMQKKQKELEEKQVIQKPKIER